MPRPTLDRKAVVIRHADQRPLHTPKKPLRRSHLDEFVAACRDREGVTSDRWKAFNCDEIVARDKANLDITWLRDESLDHLDQLPSPDKLARETVDDITAALAEFEAVATALEVQLRPGEPKETADASMP